MMTSMKNQEVLAFVEEEWLRFFPRNPYEFFFLEDYYNEQYRNEIRFGTVFGLFAFLAIFIACLGLFGLSSYTTIQRTNEIGLRKVLGSSSGNAVLLLLRYFVIQVLVAVPIDSDSEFPGYQDCQCESSEFAKARIRLITEPSETFAVDYVLQQRIRSITRHEESWWQRW